MLLLQLYLLKKMYCYGIKGGGSETTHTLSHLYS